MALGTVSYCGTLLIGEWLLANTPMVRIAIGTRVDDNLTWGNLGTYDKYAVAVIHNKLRRYETVPFSPASSAPEDVVYAEVLLASANVLDSLYPGMSEHGMPPVTENWRNEAMELLTGRIDFKRDSVGMPVYSNQRSARGFHFNEKGVEFFGTGVIKDDPKNKKWSTNR